MLRFGTFLALTVALTAAAPNPFSNVLQLDLSPEEAQKYLQSPPFSEPALSGRTAVLPLIKFNDPRFRSAEAGPTYGHYWKNGHEIENPEDYVEEVYDAKQFHGQDGLGAYGYGYETPESAKVENRVRSGNVQGSYTYRDGNNELIKVRYWSDGTGFHQEDNIPKVVLKPVEEAEDVRQARLAHEKAWQEAAAAARKQPDPQGEYYRQYDYQPNVPEPQLDYQPSASEPRQYYEQNVAPSTTSTTPEPTGPPRGFFYSFNYPVSILVPKNEEQLGSSYAKQSVTSSRQN
ncbi:unnamed protein product [Danaus chrysippus]|uniref:(African queen) hypothetical protein n=1 Tax=Danaus chrysippus TaxID=151541 RepID=A0A8J2QCZ2_9NEOP|nr:unnamed protein product [Danaus chrysippus]